ncbi:MAG TPA: hypothetical protein VLB02_02160 [Candidatus Paceibacterota bacterium]|nr:hypothetical protein [Candidatus Paceibacterota bacterium]
MEQNRGFTFAIGLVALVLGVVVGVALCSGSRVRVATDVVGRDFRAGQPYHYADSYYRTDRLRASVYDSVSRRENVYYEYSNIPETITFHSTDCTNPATIDRYSRQLNNQAFQDFANFCESVGQPIG